MNSTDVPWLQPGRGHAHAAGFFRSLAAVDITRFQPNTFLESGHIVVVLIDLAATVRSTGRQVTEDDEGFRAMFKGTAITRAKRRGLLRNVAVALGNSGDRACVPALADALRDPEPLVRAHAAWALGEIGGAEAEQSLRESLETEDSSSVRTEQLAET